MSVGLLLAALLATVPASAGEPTVAAHAFGALGRDGSPDLGGAGLGGAVGWRLLPRWSLELAVDGGSSFQPGLFLAATPQLRLALSDPLAPKPTLSASLGGGLLLAPDASGVLAAGVDLDLGGTGRWSPRLGARYLADPVDGQPGSLLFSAGLAWPRPHAAEPEPEPTQPSDTYLWVPHPVSACIQASQVHPDRLADAADEPPDQTVTQVELPSPLDLQALLEPHLGSLVVVAHPGDELLVAGHQVPLDPDWTAVLQSQTGPQEVRVRGGGRERIARPAVSDGYATWVRVGSTDEPHLVLFKVGSSELSEEAHAQLTNIARLAGGWSFQLVGQYSPEGDPRANLRLAEDRARVVRDALVAAGLSADRLKLLQAEEATILEAADSGSASVAALRSCRIEPVPPAEVP